MPCSLTPRVSTEQSPCGLGASRRVRSRGALCQAWSLHSAKKPPVDRCGSGHYGFHMRRHGPVSGVDGLLRLVPNKDGHPDHPYSKVKQNDIPYHRP